MKRKLEHSGFVQLRHHCACFGFVSSRHGANKNCRMKNYTGGFVMFFVITNIYNKKTKGPTLMELFTATGKLKKFYF